MNTTSRIDWLTPMVFAAPQFMSSSPAWHGHIPFAYWCIEALVPRTFVELGTHAGDSYLAFCQAVERIPTSTTCHAVDTWLGDDHAGYYGEDIFQKLQKYHNEHYSHFSCLVRSTFDEASKHFSDGSIDLLHIDGLHSYEAVKHDFEMWLPKLSSCAVVLFHDTNVRERDFGVYRVWEELSERYPHFEFQHSHGLGVLAVGEMIPEMLSNIIQADEGTKNCVRAVFARLGNAVTILGEPVSQRELQEMQKETIHNLQTEIETIYASRSWRVTGLLRYIGKGMRKIWRFSN